MLIKSDETRITCTKIHNVVRRAGADGGLTSAAARRGRRGAGVAQHARRRSKGAHLHSVTVHDTL